MPDLRLLDSLTEIAAPDWDRLANAAGPGRPENPFLTHRFLLALEQSGSVGTGTGWQPRPMVVFDAGRPAAASPLYAKTHSQGEYIFDHAFADAWQRAGGQYYPKLQVAVPFTPATGRRFLGDERLRGVLMAGLQRITAQNGLSSVHVTHCTADEAEAGLRAGFLPRVTQQFHWHDQGFGDFAGFLDTLASRKRKAIRKERDTAQAFGGDVVCLTGDAIQPAHWDAFWAFYQDTGARKWGHPYLTRPFFDLIHQTMRDDILLILALRNGRPVAGALNFIGRETLFGRYWGCTEDHPCLHFELCYYQAIDWALAHGLTRVEAGAQGEHKLARGYLPVPVHSLHWFADAGFTRAVADYLRREGAAMDEEMRALTGFAPFRRGALGGGPPVGGEQGD